MHWNNSLRCQIKHFTTHSISSGCMFLIIKTMLMLVFGYQRTFFCEIYIEGARQAKPINLISTNLQGFLFSLERRVSRTDSKRAPDIYYEMVSFLSDLLQETVLTPPATECTPCHLEQCILQHSDRTTSIRKKFWYDKIHKSYLHYTCLFLHYTHACNRARTPTQGGRAERQRDQISLERWYWHLVVKPWM